MTINLQKPDITELKPKITVFGVGGGGGNAVNNMINGGLQGVDFVVANTDAQALTMSAAEKVIQLGVDVTQGLGAGSQPSVGAAAAQECIDEIADYLTGTHMAFVTAGMGGGTGTGAAPVVARAAREMGVLTVGVVTKPFHFEGQRRMKTAEEGIEELQKNVDTLIVIPNQNLFRIANDKTTFADAFGMADQVLYSGVACITDLMVKEGLINLDFADVRSVMKEMGKAMMGTGESSGEGRALQAAEAAISNPLLDETSMRGAQGLLISITGGRDMTLFEVDEAATRIREEVDSEANIILGATFDEDLEGIIRVSVVATGIERAEGEMSLPVPERRIATPAATTAATTTPIRAPQAATPKPAAVATTATAAQAARIANTEESLAIPTPAAAAPRPAATQGDVRLEPFKPATSLFSDPDVEEEFKSALEGELDSDGDFFMDEAEEPLASPTQETIHSAVPDVSDFPPIAQAEMAAAKAAPAAAAPAPQEERGAMGLFKKLTNGFGARETSEPKSEPAPQPTRSVEPTIAAPTPAPAAPAASTPTPATAAPAARREPSARIDDNPYAPKAGNLDQTGRPTAQPLANDDDQLDIPAFLRRQAN